MTQLDRLTRRAMLAAFPVSAILADEQAMSAGSVGEFFARIFSDSFLFSSILLGVMAVGIAMLVFIIDDGVKKSLADEANGD